MERVVRVFVETPIVGPIKKEWCSYRYFVNYDHSDVKVFKKEDLDEKTIKKLEKEGYLKLSRLFPRLNYTDPDSLYIECLNNALYTVVKKVLELSNIRVKNLRILDIDKDNSNVELMVHKSMVKGNNDNLVVNVIECIKPGSEIVYKVDLETEPEIDNKLSFKAQLGGLRKLGFGRCTITIENGKKD